MNTTISALSRTARSVRRAVHQLITALTRKAALNIHLTVSLPPFVKAAFDYKAEINSAANDDRLQRMPRRARRRRCAAW